jgi:hypothetical protein
MEYFVLLTTLTSLIAGLLFFVDSLPGKAYPYALKFALVVFTLIVIIGGNIFVVLMILYDVFVRRKKSIKKEKKKKQELLEKLEFNRKQDQTFESIHGRAFVEQTELPWDVEHEFKFELISSSDADDNDSHIKNMNDILEDLFSKSRFDKKVSIAKRKGAKLGVKIVTKTNNISRRMSTRMSQSENNNKSNPRLSRRLSVETTLDVLTKASQKDTNMTKEEISIQKRMEQKKKARLEAMKKKGGSVFEVKEDQRELFDINTLSPGLEDKVIFDSRRSSVDSNSAIGFLKDKRSDSVGSEESSNLGTSYDENFNEMKVLNKRKNSNTSDFGEF